MADVRLGIVGLGSMGAQHARALVDGAIAGATLVAVCDSDPTRLEAFPLVARFASCDDLLASGQVDALVVATPHYDHVPLGVAALEAGVHVLIEKPLAVHVAYGQQLLDAHDRRPDLVLGFMANQRTDPRYRFLKQLLDQGELGAVHRISWTITDWFRPDAYYASSSWRATWAGEGGGVLINQCPHQLDLLCWLFGTPSRVRGFCQLGKWHDLEVEDACTAYLEFPGGATGVFVTTTGEAPGVNRLEVATDRGRVVVEEAVRWTRTTPSVTEQLRTAPGAFDLPALEELTYSFEGWGGQHHEVLANFVAAVAHGGALIGPGVEGLAAVECANAILMSSLWDRTLDLPLDRQAVAEEFRHLAASGRPAPTSQQTGILDLSDSFGHP